MRRDAGAEVEGDAIEMIARPRRAIAAALFQAGDVRIAKVPAARTLREIATERGEVTDLRRGEARSAGGDAGIGVLDPLVGGDIGDGGKGADGGGAVAAPDDAVIAGQDEIDHLALGHAGAAALGE